MNAIDTQLRDLIKLLIGTHPMAVEVIDECRHSLYREKREEGKESVSNYYYIKIFSLGVENERACAGRDGRTCLARRNSQAQTGTGGENPFLADHERDFHPYPVDAHSATK